MARRSSAVRTDSRARRRLPPPRRWMLAALAGAVAALAGPAAAQDSSLQGAEHIANMAGCFSVLYRFYEDGEHDAFAEAYGLGDPVTERIEVASRGPRSVTLANYAVLPGGREIAHWHQVWTREGGDGLWRQTVWGRAPGSSDREFRYTCAARWQKNTWSCHAGRAPKPFRDDGAGFGFMREDYVELDRDNTLLVTDEGWVHREFNEKLDASGEVVAYEIGLIVYERRPASACRTHEADSEPSP